MNSILLGHLFFQVLPDRLIFKTDPAFLPKVASGFHRGQEIVLTTFCLNPVREREHIFHKSDVRRYFLQYLVQNSLGNSIPFFVLFSRARKGSTASKCMMARWLRLAISQTYVIGGCAVLPCF